MQAVQMKVRDRLESVCRKVAGWALKSNVRLSLGASQCVQVRNEIVEQSRQRDDRAECCSARALLR